MMSILIVALSFLEPRPLLINSAIDVARIVGLPRLKAMDSYLNKATYINEMETGKRYSIFSRKEFFIHYMKFNFIDQSTRG